MLVNKNKKQKISIIKSEIEDSFSRMIHYKNVCIEKSDNITFTVWLPPPAEEEEENCVKQKYDTLEIIVE